MTTTEDGRDFAARLKKLGALNADDELRESLLDVNHHVILLSEARTLLEEIVDHAIIPLTTYTGCKHCWVFREPHRAQCMVTRARELLGRMAQHGYTE